MDDLFNSYEEDSTSATDAPKQDQEPLASALAPQQPQGHPAQGQHAHGEPLNQETYQPQYQGSHQPPYQKHLNYAPSDPYHHDAHANNDNYNTQHQVPLSHDTNQSAGNSSYDTYYAQPPGTTAHAAPNEYYCPDPLGSGHTTQTANHIPDAHSQATNDPHVQAGYAYTAQTSFDPNAQANYDPTAETRYDHNYAKDGHASNDPSGQTSYAAIAQTGYDPSGQTGYDPNGQTSYDPNGQTGYDPSGQTGYGPSGQTSYDPSGQMSYDPNGQTSYDPNGQTSYDPNGQTSYDPSGQTSYDPNVQTSYGANVQSMYDTNGQAKHDANGQASYDGSGQPSYAIIGQPIYDTSGQPGYDTNGQHSYDANQGDHLHIPDITTKPTQSTDIYAQSYYDGAKSAPANSHIVHSTNATTAMSTTGEESQSAGGYNGETHASSDNTTAQYSDNSQPTIAASLGPPRQGAPNVQEQENINATAIDTSNQNNETVSTPHSVQHNVPEQHDPPRDTVPSTEESLFHYEDTLPDANTKSRHSIESHFEMATQDTAEALIVTEESTQDTLPRPKPISKDTTALAATEDPAQYTSSHIDSVSQGATTLAPKEEPTQTQNPVHNTILAELQATRSSTVPPRLNEVSPGLLPCPDPHCDGENKPKAKFCSECGRPLLAGVSRSTTPGMSAMSPSMYMHPYPHWDQFQYPPMPSRSQMIDAQLLKFREQGYPLVTFGFGGKVITLFPRETPPHMAQVQYLKDVVNDGDDALGPLLTQFINSTLMNSDITMDERRKGVIQYMSTRIEEFSIKADEQEPHSMEQVRAKDKVLLWKLVQILVESNGNTDRAPMDIVIKNLIRPSTPTVLPDNADDGATADLPVDVVKLAGQAGPPSFDLDKLHVHLLNGERTEAAHYALAENMWAHALLLSQGSTNLWDQVVKEFLARGMCPASNEGHNHNALDVKGDGTALKIIYSLLAGSLEDALLEIEQQHKGEESMDHWRDTLALMLSNRTTDDEKAIATLGDVLKSRGRYEAAHICYVLAPSQSKYTSEDALSTGLALVGADGTDSPLQLDALFLSEIYEFSLYASPETKTASMPYLPTFKWMHAWLLSDFGHTHEAQRYCEDVIRAINADMSRTIHHRKHLVERIKALGDACENATGEKLCVTLAGESNQEPISSKETVQDTTLLDTNNQGYYSLYGEPSYGDGYQAPFTPSQDIHSNAQYLYQHDGQQQEAHESSFAPIPPQQPFESSQAVYEPYPLYSGYEQTSPYGATLETTSAQETPQDNAQTYDSYQPHQPSQVDEEDDMGLGNSLLKNDSSEPSPTAVSPGTTTPDERKEEKPASKGGWLPSFSLFKSSPKNIGEEEKKATKANLGEQSSFYYDENEKRWVNKSTASSSPAPAALPPPPKASTPSATPPPAPPGNAPSFGMARPPPMTPPVSGTPSSAPPSAMGTPRATKSKKKHRYVDVLGSPSA